MAKTFKKFFNRWFIGYLAIISIGAAIVFFVHGESEKDYITVMQGYQERLTEETQQKAQNLSNSLTYIYQGLRTISQLHSIRTIDRHGREIAPTARESIIELYNNMTSNVAVSEIYIVPVDLDPEAVDSVTGKLQEPIMMFDHNIMDKSAATENLPEEEIYEYRLMREQMAYLKTHYPNTTYVDNLNPPLISGPQVITCDNTEYNITKNDADRTGLVFSVPFYGMDGALKGTISAIIRNNALRNLIPDSNHALINATTDYVLVSKQGGQSILSSEWVKRGEPDPGLIFSTAIPLTLHDPQGKWYLWAGLPDADFMARDDVKAIADFEQVSHAITALLVILSAIVWAIQQRNFTNMALKVNNHTAELEHAVGLMELLKTVATAANEADSISEGFQSAIDSICDYTGWPVGHVYFYDKEKEKLVSGKIWHLKDAAAYAQFKSVSEETAFLAKQNFIGEVYADSTPMWILDVSKSDIYMRKEAASIGGLKAAFGFPVFIGREAVAVMEFYSPYTEIPNENLLSVMSNIGKQLGQVVERTRAKEKAKLLETVITGADDGIIITKADLDSPGPEIIYVNKAFTEISGYSAEEVIGKSPRFLQGEFTKRETLDAMRAALSEGKPFKDELLNYNKEGKQYWLDISIMPVHDDHGRITHYAAIERDITARKMQEIDFKNMWVQLTRANLKAEAVTRDLQVSLKKAEEANKAKSDFLANMSHELRTPMNGVLGMANLLADTPLSDEQQECVSTINSSGESLLMLLNDILDFSKIEAGALVLESIPYNAPEMIRQTAALLNINAEKKHINLLVDCDDALPDYVMGDPGRMRQIIMNLLGNAIKFTDTGYVRLSARMQEAGNTEMLHVRVEDTGTGIPANKLDEIFEKFTQADASVTRKYGGTGLGLAISKQLITIMGGTIGVESVEGKGSTFWFTVPCIRANEKDMNSYHIKAASLKCFDRELTPVAQAKALLVEDYHVNRIFAEKLLKKFGFVHIDHAENGSEALLKYRTKSYDIIFMDCQMPEIDGYQATEKIRALEQDTPLHTPIVAMTANAMMGDREKCLKAGMDDYISKPLRAEHLRAILQNFFLLEETKAAIHAAKKPTIVTAEQEEPPVDMEQLRMFTDGNADEEKALLELFLQQAQEMIEVLGQNLAPEKSSTWKSAAHRFKGSSGNLGAMKLHHLCKRAEVHFEDAEVNKLEMLGSIIAETKRVETYFTTH